MLTLLNTKMEHSGRFFRREAPQIFDLLQLSKKERECREEFLALKREVSRQKFENNFFEVLDDAISRRKVHQAALYYRFVRRERIRFFRDYIRRLPTHNSVAT